MLRNNKFKQKPKHVALIFSYSMPTVSKIQYQERPKLPNTGEVSQQYPTERGVLRAGALHMLF